MEMEIAEQPGIFYRHDAVTDTLAYVHINLPFRRATIEWLAGEDWVKLIIGICVSIALLCVILVFIHKKVTLFEYFNSGLDQHTIRKADKEYIRYSITNTSKNLLVLSLPASGVIEYVKSLCSKEKPRVRIDGGEVKALNALLKAKVDYQLLARDSDQRDNDQPNYSIVLLPYFDLKDSDSNLLRKQLSALDECFDESVPESGVDHGVRSLRAGFDAGQALACIVEDQRG